MAGEEGSDVDDKAHIEQRAALKKDIFTLIDPHRSSKNQKPPFSSKELIVMAIICGSKPSYRMMDVFHQICMTFQYYGQRTLNAFLKAAIAENGFFMNLDVQHDIPVLSDLWEVFQDADIPLLIDDFDPEFDPFEEPCDRLFTVSPSAARIFLERWLTPRRKGTFAFLKLPPELRNTIYEMVLVYPRPGFIYYFNTLSLFQRPDDDDLPVAYAYRQSSNPLTSIDLSDSTALLRVCQQIHEEAMPIFYGRNMFCMSRVSDLDIFMDQIGLAEVQQLRRLVLDFGDLRHSCLNSWKAVMTAIASIKKLELLIISLNDDIWFKIDADVRIRLFNRKTKFKKVEQIPGFHELAQAAGKADQFELRDSEHCPLIKAFLDTEVEKVKAGRGKSTAARKRATKSKPASKAEMDTKGLTTRQTRRRINPHEDK